MRIIVVSRKTFYKFKAEGREYAKILILLEKLIQMLEDHNCLVSTDPVQYKLENESKILGIYLENCKNKSNRKLSTFRLRSVMEVEFSLRKLF